MTKKPKLLALMEPLPGMDPHDKRLSMKLLRQMFLLMQAAEEKSAEQLADRQAPVGRNSGRRAQGDVGLGHESFEA